MFSAANDAFKIFQNYERLKTIRKKQNKEVPTLRSHGITEHSLTKLSIKSTTPKNFEVPKLANFVSFAAVPQHHQEEIVQKPVIEYIPYNEKLAKIDTSIMNNAVSDRMTTI